MIFCTLINPLLDGLIATLLQGLEIINGIFKVVISKQTLAIAKIQKEALELSDEKKVRAIGFSFEPEEEEEED